MRKKSLQYLTFSIWPFSRAFKKFLVMQVVAIYTFGLTGAGAIFLMTAMSYAVLARDSYQSHGIGIHPGWVGSLYLSPFQSLFY